MLRFMNVGYGNSVNGDKVISIVSPEAAPIKRMVQSAKDEGRAVDATCGRKTRAVLVMESGHVVLSALQPETILNRCQGKEIMSSKGDEDE
ncbi:MAG: DUF370 domain-containing protein [Lachnospiraceae bacterium]|nr:DUF370 domain-containing protein [Lachnospiraceae bacterium]